MIGSLINLISWFFSLPFWVFVVIIIVIAVLNIFIRPSDNDNSSGDYSSSEYTDYSDSSCDREFQTEINKVEHPFVFYDFSGNRCGRGSCFYDSKGIRRSWGEGFYDAKGYYRNWGDGFYDSQGYYRNWGDCFYDTQGNLVYPNL